MQPPLRSSFAICMCPNQSIASSNTSSSSVSSNTSSSSISLVASSARLDEAQKMRAGTEAMNQSAAQDCGTSAVPHKVTLNLKDNAFKTLKEMPLFMLALLPEAKEEARRAKPKAVDIDAI